MLKHTYKMNGFDGFFFIFVCDLFLFFTLKNICNYIKISAKKSKNKQNLCKIISASLKGPFMSSAVFILRRRYFCNEALKQW